LFALHKETFVYEYVMILVPVPAVDGVKTPVGEFTPGPEYIPPNGMPPLSLKGFAFTDVIVSKQDVKVTIGARVPLIMIFAELAGLPVTQARFDVITHRTLSPFAGL
jgi:hypothetical protein